MELKPSSFSPELSLSEVTLNCTYFSCKEVEKETTINFSKNMYVFLQFSLVLYKEETEFLTYVFSIQHEIDLIDAK